MSSKKSFDDHHVHPKETKMVKDVDAKELETVIVTDMKYNIQFLHEHRVTRLRAFAAYLLYLLRLSSWAALRDMNALFRQAALLTLIFPPPDGALEYFEVCTRRLCVCCFLYRLIERWFVWCAACSRVPNERPPSARCRRRPPPARMAAAAWIYQPTVQAAPANHSSPNSSRTSQNRQMAKPNEQDLSARRSACCFVCCALTGCTF